MERSLTVVVGVTLLALAACNEPPTRGTDRAGASPLPEAAPASVADERTGRSLRPSADEPSGRSLRPSVAERIVAKEVAWPEQTWQGLAARARFGEAELAKIDAAGVPVLAPLHGLERADHPDDPSGPFARAVVVAKPDWFTLSLADAAFEATRLRGRAPGERADGITVFVQGTRLAKRVADVPPVVGRASVRGHSAWITQNEHVWHATWEENGVSYVVELECAKVEDARCADDAHLRAIAESLQFVGGRGALVGGSR